jgi:hypothetical protein
LVSKNSDARNQVVLKNLVSKNSDARNQVVLKNLVSKNLVSKKNYNYVQ